PLPFYHYISRQCPFLRLFFHHPPSTNIYTLSLHDALPISKDHLLPIAGIGALSRQIGDPPSQPMHEGFSDFPVAIADNPDRFGLDRKSTRLNSSHVKISYAVFCLKKKTKFI